MSKVWNLHLYPWIQAAIDLLSINMLSINIRIDYLWLTRGYSMYLFVSDMFCSTQTFEFLHFVVCISYTFLFD